MCLAIPVKVVEILGGGEAVIEISGTKKTINVDLIDGLKVGDYVILHVGYALQKIDPEEARKTLEMFKNGQETAAPVL